jgi:hypothetical protein
MSPRASKCAYCGLPWSRSHECPTSGPEFAAGLRAAATGVLLTEAEWSQLQRDAYAAGWLRGTRRAA